MEKSLSNEANVSMYIAFGITFSTTKYFVLKKFLSRHTNFISSHWMNGYFDLSGLGSQWREDVERNRPWTYIYKDIDVVQHCCWGIMCMLSAECAGYEIVCDITISIACLILNAAYSSIIHTDKQK